MNIDFLSFHVVQSNSMLVTALILQVIYEDDDLLAVSKPPFLVTAPKHRWQVHLFMSSCYLFMYPWQTEFADKQHTAHVASQVRLRWTGGQFGQ